MGLRILPAQLIPLASLLLLLGSTSAQLRVDYYSQTCPNAEEIVRNEMNQILSAAPSLAPAFLRLHFHDCFVRGCDGSVLLDSTPETISENAKPNTLRGFGSVERVKVKLETDCPNTVSCADILALMARDAVFLVEFVSSVKGKLFWSKGPTWQVMLGRRDGRISIKAETMQLAPPKSNLTQLIQKFAAKGLDLKDIVVLSGAHTIGTAHCSTIRDSLFNNTDPFFDIHYITRLRSKCSPTDNSTRVEMDPGSYKTFDTGYYEHLAKRRSLFHSDLALLTDSFTKAYVLKYASRFQSEFFQDFAESMIKMGNIDVLTGSQGEIRKKCNVVNY